MNMWALRTSQKCRNTQTHEYTLVRKCRHGEDGAGEVEGIIACRKTGAGLSGPGGQGSVPTRSPQYPQHHTGQARPRGGAGLLCEIWTVKTVPGDTKAERQDRRIGGNWATWIPVPFLSPW